MPIYDQFDVEHKGSFQSSSVDRVFFGNIANSIDAPTSTSIQNSPRYVYGGKVSKYNDFLSQESLSPVKHWRFSDWLAFRSGSYFPSLLRGTVHVDANTVYYDSMPPNLYKLAVAANATLTTYTSPFGVELQDPSLDIYRPLTMSSINVPYKGTSKLYQTFPYEYSYRGIERLRNLSTISEFTVAGITYNRVPFFSIERNDTERMFCVDVTSSSPIESFLPSIGGALEDGNEVPPRLETIFKALLGFGDGLSEQIINQPWSIRQYYNQFPNFKYRHFPDPNYLLEPVIRGYRYGMLSHAPKSRKYIFNRTHFGYLSDLQYSDPYSTMYENQPDFICNIRFVSGSQAKISSSLDDEIVRNSGIYSTNYLSGTPFFD